MNMARSHVCRDKIRHPSRGKAEAALRALCQKQPEDAARLVAYLCIYCDGFHVGHKRKVRR